MKITTYDDLKGALQMWLIYTASDDRTTTDADVLRFIAARKAEELSDMGRRETINLFVDGIAPMSKELVVEWLEIAEECAEGDDDMRPDWDNLFEDFYGPKIATDLPGHTEITTAYKKYVAKQRQGRQRGWMSIEGFEQSYTTMAHVREAYGPK